MVVKTTNTCQQNNWQIYDNYINKKLGAICQQTETDRTGMCISCQHYQTIQETTTHHTNCAYVLSLHVSEI